MQWRHCWKQITAREKLIFLMLFAVLLPTVILIVVQYYSLSDLRERSEAFFEIGLRQNFQQIEEKAELRAVEIGEKILQKFPEEKLQTWDSTGVKSDLQKILAGNPEFSAAYAFSGIKSGLSYTAIATENGYQEFVDDESKPRKPDEKNLFNSAEEEDVILSLLAAMESGGGRRISKAYVVTQSRCEKCASENPNETTRSYIFRPLSNPRDVIKLRFVAVRLKNEFVVNQLLPQAIKDTVEQNTAKENDFGVINFAVFDDRQNLIFTNSTKNTAWENFEAQTPLTRVFPLWTIAGNYQDSTIRNLSDLYFRRNLLLIILVVGELIIGVLLIFHVTTREIGLAQAKSAFVSNVSHELKTPLALIRLFAETLESGRVKNTEKAQEYYRIISSETRRLTQLINNILDFAAIEAGRKEYNFKPQDLSQTVSEVVQNYAYVLETNEFTLKTDFEKDLPPVTIDRDAICQAVLNLLNNAVKYSADEKHVEVNVERRNGSLAVEVTDHGVGIAPNEQNKIFDNFYRVGGANDVHNVKGSGLGLSLVKHIIEAHGGSVSVNSVLHRGSTFTILLPIEREK